MGKSKKSGDGDADVEYNCQSGSSNALILPVVTKKKRKQGSSKKLDARGKLSVNEKKRALSKKKQKLREKMAERKSRRANRSEILEELKKFQLSTEELVSLHSVAKMQQKQAIRKVNALAGANRKRRNEELILDTNNTKSPAVWQTTPYFETDSSSSDSEIETKRKAESNIEFKVDKLNQNSYAGAAGTTKDPNEIVVSDAEEPVAVSVKEEKLEVRQDTIPAVKSELKKALSISEAKMTSERSPAVFVSLDRNEEIQTERAKLPIFAEEQVIVEAIRENAVVIICGETGSGKTTQVPQFLYEAGFAQNGRMIGVTEPRRVAAISMSQRVATEMNLSLDLVSYQIRFEGNSTEKTEIKFMTDGVLMKELQNDIKLSKYSVIIIDEAHERSMYSDILIGLLSRIAPMRARNGDPLKLIIMSATLRVEDFMQKHLFRVEPKLLKVESRQYPVTMYFNKKTPGKNYLQEVYKKVCRVHEQLPEGGILVFLSGQREVQTLIKWLTKTYPMRNSGSRNNVETVETEANRRKKEKKLKKLAKKNALKAAVIDLESYNVGQKEKLVEGQECHDVKERGNVSTKNLDLDEIGAADDLDLFEDEADWSESFDAQSLMAKENAQPLYCLPMYSLLPTQKQARVFMDSPDDCCLCVVSTNVAETSLTIPNVKYVVDSGKQKRRLFDPVTGVSKFQVGWTSKASANQRAGRAGRTGPGHCYRLYSSAVFNHDFEDFSTPDIINKPVDELILQMKSMNIVKVRNFPFPTTPDPDSLESGERRLLHLGALEMKKKRGQTGTEDPEARITPLGKTIALFPVKPQYGKILALANQWELLPYAVCIVAALSVREPLLNPTNLVSSETRDQMLKFIRKRRQWAGKGQNLFLGDLSVLLGAVGSAEFEGMTPDFCQENGIRYKAMTEIRKMRKQLTNLLNSACDLGGTEELVLDTKMPPPTEEQCMLLRQIILAGLADNVAKRCEVSENQVKSAYFAQGMSDPVFIHPTSVLYKQEPDWLVYQEVIEGSQKKYMQTVCAVELKWLPMFAGKLCNFGKRISDTEPFYCQKTDEILEKISCTFGPSGWSLPDCERACELDLQWYKWLAVEILEGNVFPKLGKFREKLLASPKTVVKSWGHLQPRTKGIVNALIAQETRNAKLIRAQWEENSDFLLNQYLDWVPEFYQDEVRSIWPPY